MIIQMSLLDIIHLLFIYQFDNKIYKVQMSNQVKALLCGALLSSLGFQNAEKTTIPAILKRICPKGGTAMRDSLIAGCQLMLKLNQALKQMDAAQNWHFVHVILTDGIDQHSKNDLEDAAKIMLIIGKLIQVKALKIIFIGVGVQGQAEQELKLLAAAGGQNAEYYNVNSGDIGNVFNKIQINLGIQQNLRMVQVASGENKALLLHKEVKPCLQVSVKNFAVMFNLDVSGSMSGNKWSNVCSSVDSFVNKLGDSDFVSGLVFNHEVKLISNMQANDPLFKNEAEKQKSGMIVLSEENCNPQ